MPCGIKYDTDLCKIFAKELTTVQIMIMGSARKTAVMS